MGGRTARRQQPKPHRPMVPPLSDEYITERIEVVAFLMCRGQMVLRFVRERGRVRFAFPGRILCEELQSEFMIGEGLVTARNYADNLNWARSALHQV